MHSKEARPREKKRRIGAAEEEGNVASEKGGGTCVLRTGGGEENGVPFALIQKILSQRGKAKENGRLGKGEKKRRGYVETK